MDNKNIEIKSNNYTIDINNNKYELSLNYKDTHALLLNKQGPQGKTGNGIISMVLIYADQEKSTYRINYTNGTFQDIDLHNGLSGTTHWGSILGNITNQADLNNALNNRELLSNKTTSLNSSSTDTQYPSSKAVYDITNSLDTRVAINENDIISLKEKKADKASIIMRNYNFQVGSTTNPIYVNTGGYVQPCNFDIGRYRFDGQWTVMLNPTVVSKSTAIGTYDIDLTEHLPNDNYSYELLMFDYASRSGNSGTNTNILIWNSDIGQNVTSSDPDKNTFFSKIECDGANFQQANNSFVAYVTPTRKLKKSIFNAGATISTTCLIGYRRIGTNE